MNKKLLGIEELKYLIQLIKQKIKSVADNKQDSHDDRLETENKDIVDAINEVNNKTEPEVVIVDLVKLYTENDVETFRELTEKASRGEITILVKYNSLIYSVNMVVPDSDNPSWTFCGAEISHVDQNPRPCIVVAKIVLHYTGTFFIISDSIDFSEILSISQMKSFPQFADGLVDELKVEWREMIDAVGKTEIGNIENLKTESKEIVGAINEVNAKVGQGGGSSEKEVVLVDIAELIMANDIDKFNDLSQQALNGEIAIFVNLEGSVYAVNYIHEGGDSYTWTFVGAEYYQMEANPTSAIIIGKLLILNGAFEPFIEHVDLGEFLKTADTSKIVKEGLTNNTETFTDDEKQSARDLIGAVGVNNYAKPDGKTYGIVRAESWSPVTVDNNGTLIANVATDADIADRYRHRLLRCSDIDKAVKAGVTTNTEELTDDEKASARNWVGAVGFTDMPSPDGTKAGLYQIRGHGNGGLKVGADGKTEIQPPSEALIKQRCADRPLTPKEIDYIIRYGLTGYKETWNGSLGQMVPSYENYTAFTDEEKGYACNLIGAMPRPTGSPMGTALLQVSFNPALGTTTYNYASTGYNAGNIMTYSSTSTDMSVMYGNGVTIYVDTPTGNKMAANKMYVDNLPDYLTLTDEQKAKWKVWLQAILA